MVKIFYYQDGRVRVTTEFYQVIFTAEEWAIIGRSFQELDL